MRLAIALILCALPCAAQFTNAKSIQGKPITAYPLTQSTFTTSTGISVEYTVTETVNYTDLKCAATTCNLTGVTLPAGFKVRGMTVTEVTPMACTGGCSGITAMTVSVGPNTNYLAYCCGSGWALFNSAGSYFDWAGGHYSSTSSAVQLYYQFVVTNGTPGNFGNGSATNLTAGQVTIRIWGVV